MCVSANNQYQTKGWRDLSVCNWSTGMGAECVSTSEAQAGSAGEEVKWPGRSH